MLDRLLSLIPGSRTARRHAAVMAEVETLGAVLRRPGTDPAAMELAIQRIIQTGRAARAPRYRTPLSLEETASAWAEALSARAYIPIRRGELLESLRGMAERIAEASAGDLARISGEAGRELGQRLRVTPRAFEDLLEVLIPWVEHHHPSEDDTGFPIRAKALAAFAGAFAEGARNRVFDEQLTLAESLGTLRQRRCHDLVRFDPLEFLNKLREDSEPMVQLDRHGRVLAANPSAMEILALPDDDSIAMLDDCAYGDRDSAVVQDALESIADGVILHVEFAVAWPEGTFKAWVRATLCWHAPTGDNPGRIGLVVEDATAQYAWRRQLDQVTNRDDVTDLPSRNAFLDRAQVRLDAAARRENDSGALVGVCVIRLVGLNRITRELGPQHADAVITAAAARTAAALSGTSDATIGRLDRDTVAILLADPRGWADAARLVRRLSAWLAEPVRAHRRDLVISPRIGVAEADPRHTTAKELLTGAEAALDTDLAPARRPWTATDDGGSSRQAGMSLIAALPRAMADDELHLAYSPVIRISDGAIDGLRVHVRWQHPDLGDIPADPVIALADELGVDLPLCRWALTTATRDAARWRRDHPYNPPFVQLTVPARQAADEALLDQTRAALTDSGLPPHLLQLALPPDRVLGEDGRVRPQVTGLDTMGVSLVLHGFGTTFADYHQLTNLPLRGVLIPSELTANLHNGLEHRPLRTVAHAFVGIATDLGRTAQLDGIINPDQLHDARFTAATHAHGTLFGHPLPADDIDALLHDKPALLSHNWVDSYHHIPVPRR
ncbi:EAL domain, c-di-GMP-specific phosphodiesterase class I (or its enzymatically inactive variant) [Actinokineospora alba]|uniref:EAL domain, c-di-GMP-specific phosphodiesterase class I (Or its enzymatically inactive variant) n=1 Tax=Actinokineospora alba TaxID=504798 RepID=A0A1H0LZ15_9PSEU|nr:EAL domain-containing protein [Actinokineospora alba]TDP67512.1 EAL domain-containing protein (putative c-di-GMP-specific phosphodiesterase class I) [Actinokineospora alba]SDI46700.1 EAL domain, c-di-GMP-specific phosphodiesterase class I (or its enzymatically inactive variant) [Actinokineospora alba]SDO73291.1 EAL domain, c-di-GMP-specific phosphodiesterase class I (or its enzymatically inactive variant) [Actinokineospora alba]